MTSERAIEPLNEGASADAGRTKLKLGPNVSLFDAYPEASSRGPEPKMVARALRQREGWAFPKPEVDRALEVIPSRDTDFRRTRSLVHELADHPQLGLAATDFGAKAIASEIGDALSSWPPHESVDESRVGEILAAVANRLGPRARKVAKKGDAEGQLAARRAHHALMIAVDYLSVTHGLAVEEAVPILRVALGAPAELESPRSNRRRVRMRALTDDGLGRDRLRALLELLQPWIEQLRETVDANRRAEEEARAVQVESNRLAGRNTALTTQIEELEEILEDVRQKEILARDRLRDAGALATSDLREVRGRLASSLDSRVRMKLEAAGEAAALDPPRARVISRMLDDALREVEEQVKWLRSSD